MRTYATKQKCLRCRMDDPQREDRIIIVICLADVPSGDHYADSEYQWVHKRAFCKRHWIDVDENGYIPVSKKMAYAKDKALTGRGVTTISAMTIGEILVTKFFGGRLANTA